MTDRRDQLLQQNWADEWDALPEAPPLVAARYVTSVGVSTRWGLHRHRYYDTRRRWPLRWFRILGVTVVVTSYRRSGMRFP